MRLFPGLLSQRRLPVEVPWCLVCSKNALSGSPSDAYTIWRNRRRIQLKTWGDQSTHGLLLFHIRHENPGLLLLLPDRELYCFSTPRTMCNIWSTSRGLLHKAVIVDWPTSHACHCLSVYSVVAARFTHVSLHVLTSDAPQTEVTCRAKQRPD